MAGDQMISPKARKVLVFSEAAASNHKWEDLNKHASHDEACDLVLSSCDIASESCDCPDSLSDGDHKVCVIKWRLRNCTLKMKAE